MARALSGNEGYDDTIRTQGASGEPGKVSSQKGGHGGNKVRIR